MHISIMLVLGSLISLVRNRVVLAVYLLFSVACFFTVHEHYRIDLRYYPEIAVREALLNLLVHGEYSFSASALVSIYADRIEFVSIGGLLPGIDLEDIMAGISICRNQDLANVFYCLRLIEVYDTGMGKIMKAYEGLAEKPIIETTQNTFKIILPNRNARNNITDLSVSKAESASNSDIDIKNMIDDSGESEGKVCLRQLWGSQCTRGNRRALHLYQCRHWRDTETIIKQ